MADLMTNLFNTWDGLAVIVIASAVLGLVGRYWRPIRVILVGLAPLCSAAIIFYFVFEGSMSQCSGYGVTLHCWEVSYASAIWSRGGWAVAGVAMAVILTLAPIASAWLRRSTPSVVAACVLPLLIATFFWYVASWTYAWPAVLAAAIAGPPSRESRGWVLTDFAH